MFLLSKWNRDRATKRQAIKDPPEKGINADAAFPVANDGAPPGDSLLAVAVGSRCRRETCKKNFDDSNQKHQSC